MAIGAEERKYYFWIFHCYFNRNTRWFPNVSRRPLILQLTDKKVTQTRRALSLTQ